LFSLSENLPRLSENSLCFSENNHESTLVSLLFSLEQKYTRLSENKSESISKFTLESLEQEPSRLRESLFLLEEKSSHSIENKPENIYKFTLESLEREHFRLSKICIKINCMVFKPITLLQALPIILKELIFPHNIFILFAKILQPTYNAYL